MWKNLWQNIKSWFISGLITSLPLFITIWLLYFFFTFLDGILGNLITLIWGYKIPGLGLVLIVFLILATGWIAQFLLGRRIFKMGEDILNKLPLISNIYSSVRQINDVFFMEKSVQNKGFNRAAIVEYPSKGIWSIGFVTSEAAQEIEEKSGNKLVNVFIANTPTPATGFLIMVPTKDVKLLDMRVDQAFKYIVSGGVLRP